MGVSIPAEEVVLDSAPPESSSSAVPIHEGRSPDSIEIPADQVSLDEDRYSSTGQSVLAHAEAVGRGLAGPLATAAERAIGVPAEDIKKRETANPEVAATEVGTFGLSMLTGVGEAELVGRAGLKAAEMAEAAAVSNRAIRAALRTGVETALIQSGDEVNKMILGDPASASDVALAAGIGLVAGGALGSVPALWKATKEKSVGKWLRSAGDALSEAEAPTIVETAAKKVGKVLFDVPEAATEGYLKNVEGVQKAADDLWSVAEKLPRAVSDVAEAGGKLSKEARAALSEDRSIPFTDVAEILHEVPSKKALAELEKFRGDIELRAADVTPQLGHDMLSQKEVRGLMDELAKDTNFRAPLPTAEKASLRQAYGKLNETLKKANPKYAEEIGHSAEHLSLKEDLVKKLRLVKDYGSDYGFRPTDTTVVRLKDLMRGDKREVKDILDTLKKLGHADLADEVKNTLIKQAFTKDATRGSRSAVVGGTTGAAIGRMTGIPGGTVAGGAAGSWLGAMADRYGAKAYYDILGKLGRKAPKELGTSTLKDHHAALPLARAVFSDEASGSGAKAAVDYTAAVVKGENRIKNVVKATLERGGTSLLNLVPSESDKEKVKKEAQALRDTPEQFLARQNDLSHHMPDNSMALVASKARVLSYLNELEPKTQEGLPFDDSEIDPAAEKRFERALELATSPLVVMTHIQKGTLELDHVKDINHMYPDLSKYLRNKIFNGMVDIKSKKEKPSYKVRQGLSLFTGQPMDSTFLPQNIMAAQSTFAMHKASQQAQQPQVTKTKSHLSKLSQAFATGDQAAASRTKGGF